MIADRHTTTDAFATIGLLDNRVIIHARGEFDIFTSQALADALRDATDSGFDVIVDLQEAEFLDLCCLGLILHTREELAARGRSLTIRNARSVVSVVAEMLGINELVPLERPAADA